MDVKFIRPKLKYVLCAGLVVYGVIMLILVMFKPNIQRCPQITDETTIEETTIHTSMSTQTTYETIQTTNILEPNDLLTEVETNNEITSESEIEKVPTNNSTEVVTQIYVETAAETSVTTKIQPEPKYVIDISEQEIHELAALVTLEADIESLECMKGVASVVINRANNSNMSIHDVLYQKNQFSPASYIANTTGSDRAYKAVYEVLINGPIFPNNVTYFRANRYHSWSANIVPYTVMDHTYFSADITIEEKGIQYGEY